jgi:hypothetical protein
MGNIGHYKVHPDYVDKLFEIGKKHIVLIDKETGEEIDSLFDISLIRDYNEYFLGSLKTITTRSGSITMKIKGMYKPKYIYITIEEGEQEREYETPFFTKKSSRGTGELKNNVYRLYGSRSFKKERIGYIPTGVLKIYEENGIWVKKQKN